MQKNYAFTRTAILTKIAHWTLEPFTLDELNYLLKFFCPTDYPDDNPSYTYSMDDIESYILEILSEMDA